LCHKNSIGNVKKLRLAAVWHISFGGGCKIEQKTFYMKKTTTFLTILLIMLVRANVWAQTPPPYAPINPVAIGVRINPDGGGLTAKIFLSRNWVFEAQINGSGGFYHTPDTHQDYGGSATAVGLLEYHYIFQDPSWRIYFGAGIHGGKWDKFNFALNNDAPRPRGIFGADAIAGGEYCFKAFPLGISADIKPAVNIAGDKSFFYNNSIGIAARFYFGRKVVILTE
jgi:hypothetical protein